MATVLWTDLIDPVEATAIAREEQINIERARGGTLARFLPNVEVDSDHIKFYVNAIGLVDAARYRAFNAPPELGRSAGLQSKTLDLPAISRSEPIDEMTQKEIARLSDDRIRKSISDAIRRNVQAISQTQERARGIVIDSGKLVIDQDNYGLNDDFGRDPGLSLALGSGNWWSDPAVDRLVKLAALQDIYASFNQDANPGRMVFGSRNAYNQFAAGNQFKTIVGASTTRPGLASEVAAYVASAGLPEFEIYERRVMVEGVLTPVLDPKAVYFLPEPVDPSSADGSLLGATYWGRTISSGFASWGIQPDEQPGIVCGVYREETVGSSIEVQGDSIGEPVAVNANASMKVQVLA